MLRFFMCAALFATFVLATCATGAWAQTETPITVQVLAQNGRPIGVVAGEAQVSLRDRITGDVMASGMTYLGKFDVSIDLVSPTPATLSISGPMASLPAMAQTTRDILLIPGKDYTASGGITLTLPGALVHLTAPDPDQIISSDAASETLVSAHIVGLDGTPANSDTHDVDVMVYKGAVHAGTVRMTPAKESGRFVSKLKFPEPGTYMIIVTAYDRARKDSAMDQGIFVVSGENKQPGKR